MEKVEKSRRERGLEVYRQMGWNDNPTLKALDPELWAFTTDAFFGEIWARDGMSLRERELITMSTLIAAQAWDGLMHHMRSAHHLGITFPEIRELILQCTIYLGLPQGLIAMRRLQAVMAEKSAAAESAQ